MFFFISCSSSIFNKKDDSKIDVTIYTKEKDKLILKDSILLKRFNDNSIELPAIENNSPIIFIEK